MGNDNLSIFLNVVNGKVYKDKWYKQKFDTDGPYVTLIYRTLFILIHVGKTVA